MLTQPSPTWFNDTDLEEFTGPFVPEHVRPASLLYKWEAGDMLTCKIDGERKYRKGKALGFDIDLGRGCFIELDDGWGWFDGLAGLVEVVKVKRDGKLVRA